MMKSRQVSSLIRFTFRSVVGSRVQLCDNCQHIVVWILLALVVTGCSVLNETVQSELENRADRAAQSKGIHTVRLDRWTDDVPKGTTLRIDTSNNYEVYLITGNKEWQLGKLYKQFVDTPLISMFLDTGKDRFIIGWVEETVPDDIATVTLGRYVAESEPRPVSGTLKTWRADKDSRMFFIPIYEPEVSDWESITYIFVDTEASLRAHSQNKNTPSAFQKEYNPYIPIGAPLQVIVR